MLSLGLLSFSIWLLLLLLCRGINYAIQICDFWLFGWIFPSIEPGQWIFLCVRVCVCSLLSCAFCSFVGDERAYVYEYGQWFRWNGFVFVVLVKWKHFLVASFIPFILLKRIMGWCAWDATCRVVCVAYCVQRIRHKNKFVNKIQGESMILYWKVQFFY